MEKNRIRPVKAGKRHAYELLETKRGIGNAKSYRGSEGIL